MKKLAVIGSTLAAVLVASSMAIPVFAASNPADDASGYSYNTGKQSYESRMSEDHAWYDNENDSVTSGYSFNVGSQAAQSRNSAFAQMPAGDDLTKEDIEAWFETNGIGEGSAWSDGQYNESAKGSYGSEVLFRVIAFSVLSRNDFLRLFCCPLRTVHHGFRLSFLQ